MQGSGRAYITRKAFMHVVRRALHYLLHLFGASPSSGRSGSAFVHSHLCQVHQVLGSTHNRLQPPLEQLA